MPPYWYPRFRFLESKEAMKGSPRLRHSLSLGIQLCFYRMDMTHIRKYVSVLDAIMADNIPRVYNHLRSMDITTDLYIMDWILTLFSKVLPFPFLHPLPHFLVRFLFIIANVLLLLL